MKDLLQVEIGPREDGRWCLEVWVDLAHYEHLTERVFGMRLLMTDQHAWTDAEILIAYRRQARAERAFRDLKDPGQLAVRPTFHWTPQKLHVQTAAASSATCW